MNQKKSFKEYFSKRIDENFSTIEKFVNHDLHELCALNSIKFEILNCLILGLYQSSITATNHLLERTLKLSLIKLESQGVNYSDIEKYTRVMNHVHKQYDHLYIHQTLKNNRNKGLITAEEFEYLSEVSKTMRDAYSHAQTLIINKEVPSHFTGFKFNLEDIKESLKKGEKIKDGEKINIPNTSPAISQYFQENVSKNKALIYFENVYNVIVNIENRLRKKKLNQLTTTVWQNSEVRQK